MRILRVVAVLCVLSVFALPARSQDNSTVNMDSGNYLIGACQVAIKVEDNPNSLIPASDEFKIGYCAGVSHGVTVAMEVTQQACLPNGVTNGQEVRVVEKYLQDHPAQLNFPGPILAMRAIQKAFPCKK